MKTVGADELDSAVTFVRAANGGHYPWVVVGVFPTEDQGLGPGEGNHWWNSFLYTVGLCEDLELWIPYASIEGWGGGFDLMGNYLNGIAAGWLMGTVGYGDAVTLPIGIPDEDDGTAVFWIGRDREPARKRQVYRGMADWCVPVLWSSPLGWEA